MSSLTQVVDHVPLIEDMLDPRKRKGKPQFNITREMAQDLVDEILYLRGMRDIDHRNLTNHLVARLRHGTL